MRDLIYSFLGVEFFLALIELLPCLRFQSLKLHDHIAIFLHLHGQSGDLCLKGLLLLLHLLDVLFELVYFSGLFLFHLFAHSHLSGNLLHHQVAISCFFLQPFDLLLVLSFELGFLFFKLLLDSE